jgi:hypothetical protein
MSGNNLVIDSFFRDLTVFINPCDFEASRSDINFRGHGTGGPKLTKLKLESITLPNVAAITQEPYLLLTIRPKVIDEKFLFTSNNTYPIAAEATFFIPMSESPTSTNEFITIKPKMKQTLMFRMDDTFVVKITNRIGTTIVVSDGSDDLVTPLRYRQIIMHFSVKVKGNKSLHQTK